ncbi:MAG: hypothetical protein ACLP01_07075, partial [Solirubrobacteraceae bacterium]
MTKSCQTAAERLVDFATFVLSIKGTHARRQIRVQPPFAALARSQKLAAEGASKADRWAMTSRRHSPVAPEHGAQCARRSMAPELHRDASTQPPARRSSMLQRGRLLLAVVAAAGGMTLANAATASADGGCSPANAPVIAAGIAQSSDGIACSGAQYWAISLQIGDTLNLPGVPGQPAGYLSLDVYGPNVQTIGQSLCSAD